VNPKHLYKGKQSDIETRNSSPEKFWARVDKNGPVLHQKLGRCWIWTGGKFTSGGGYGQVQYQKKHWPAHRVAWLLTHGDIPQDLLLCHKCDNPPCVRPSHMFLGTNQQNTDDMVAKGRHKSGTYERTLEIRAKISAAAKLRKRVTGWHHSEETKAKIRDAHLGKKMPEAAKEKIRKAMLGNTYAKGYRFTPEQREHQREMLLRRYEKE